MITDQLTKLDMVNKYLEIGFKVLPLRPGTKLPVAAYYNVNSDKLTRELFTTIVPDSGVALYMGQDDYDLDGNDIKFGNFFALDFDNPEAYMNWEQANPGVAKIAPTALTPKGYHVIVQANETPYSGKGPTVSIISDHWYIAVAPTIHPSGVPYKWLRPPWDGVPLVKSLDDISAGIDMSRIDLEVEDYCEKCGSPSDCQCHFDTFCDCNGEDCGNEACYLFYHGLL